MKDCIQHSALVILFAMATANAQSGGGYVIRKGTVGGGGGTAVGGDFRVTGTVGQHDATELSGGGYLLHGGFWTPGAMADVPDGPIADPSNIDKTRFISMSMTGSSLNALRVQLTSLHHVIPPYTAGPSVPFTALEGQARWVGPPADYQESTSNPILFNVSLLQCTPHYQAWGTVGLLHIAGSAVVPSSIYHIEAVASACQGNESSPACSPGGSLVSAQLQIKTTRWGDVQTPYNPPSATAQPDVGDMAALVSKFRSSPGAPIKARALLAGDDAFGNITSLGVDMSFTHIAACVDAFRGKPYPYAIQSCP